MRIALVIYHADPTRGGAERYTIDLAVALHRAGHAVSVLATSFTQIPDGVQCVPLAHLSVTRKGKYHQFLRSLETHLDATSYDVVHAMLPVRRCDLYHPHAGLAAAAFPTWKKKLAAIFNPRRLAFAKIERQLLNDPSQSTAVLCLSDVVKRDLKRWYRLPDERLPILFNAIDLNRFQPGEYRPQSNRVSLLMIANDFARKGLATLLRAVQQLNEPQFRLTVIGKEAASPYMRLAERLGIAEQVQFVGPTSDPRFNYQMADVFVLPTSHDPCSLVVLEALAMGVPVITTKINGASEIMTDGEHGFVLDDPKDVTALADRLRRMLDVDARKRMSGACLALRPRLAYERHLEALLTIYASTMSGDG